MREIDIERERGFDNAKVEGGDLTRWSQNKFYWAVKDYDAEFLERLRELSTGSDALKSDALCARSL